MYGRRLIEALLWMVVLIWAGNYTLGKVGMREFSPAAFTALRFAIATPFMFLLLRWREGAVRFSRPDLPRLVVVGVIGVALYQTVFIAAVKYTTVTTASLMLGLSPIFTAFFNALSGYENLRPSYLLGAGVAFAGLTLVISSGPGELGLNAATLKGDILAFIASVLWGLYPVLATPILKKHSALWVTAHSSLIGVAVLLIYSTPDLWSMNWPAVSRAAWASLLYAAIPVTVISLVAWYYGIEKIGANQVMIYMYMITPTAMAIAALTIGETINAFQIIGTGITLLGVYLVKRQPVSKRPDQAEAENPAPK